MSQFQIGRPYLSLVLAESVECAKFYILSTPHQQVCTCIPSAHQAAILPKCASLIRHQEYVPTCLLAYLENILNSNSELLLLFKVKSPLIAFCMPPCFSVLHLEKMKPATRWASCCQEWPKASCCQMQRPMMCWPLLLPQSNVLACHTRSIFLLPPCPPSSFFNPRKEMEEQWGQVLQLAHE